MAVKKPTDQIFEHVTAVTPVQQDLDISAVPGIILGNHSLPVKCWINVEVGSFVFSLNGTPTVSLGTGMALPFQIMPGDTLSFEGSAQNDKLVGSFTN